MVAVLVLQVHDKNCLQHVAVSCHPVLGDPQETATVVCDNVHFVADLQSAGHTYTRPMGISYSRCIRIHTQHQIQNTLTMHNRFTYTSIETVWVQQYTAFSNAATATTQRAADIVQQTPSQMATKRCNSHSEGPDADVMVLMHSLLKGR